MERHVSPKSGTANERGQQLRKLERRREGWHSNVRGHEIQTQARDALSVSTVMWGHEKYETGNRIPVGRSSPPTPSLYNFWTRIPSSTHCSGTMVERVHYAHWCCARPGHCLGSYAGETSGRHSLQQTPSSSGSYSLPIPSSEMIPEPWVQELCCRCINQSEERKHDVPRL